MNHANGHGAIESPTHAIQRARDAAEPVPEPVVAAHVVRVPMVEANDIRFRQISTSDGLSQTRVAQLVQDDRGFMWFGTQYGLNRYDGYEFKLFVHDPGNDNSLSGAFIFSLLKDRSGMLWIGCNQTLDRFDPKTESFTHYRIEGDEPDSLGGTVIHISQDREGALWLATDSGLHRLDPTTGAIKHYRYSVERPTGLRTNEVKWTGQDRSGNLWVGTSEGLDKFDPATGSVTFHIPIADPVQISFFEDRIGNFWILHASGEGLALYNRKLNTLTRYTYFEQSPSPSALTGVMGMTEDDDGNLWIGSPEVGLLRYDRLHGQFIRYRNRARDRRSVGENKAIALFQDHEGNIWIGHHSAGLSVFARQVSKFESFKRDPDDPEGLTTDFVNTIYEYPLGTLWVGTDDGLNKIDREAGKRTLLATSLGAKPMVITITADSFGTIWFGSFGGGLNSYDPTTGRFRSYRHNLGDQSSLSNDAVHRVFIDHAGNLWVATEDGLDRFVRETQSFQTFKFSPKSQQGQFYASIAEDASGNLWLGTAHLGLQKLATATGTFTVYKNNPHDLNSLRDNTVPAVYVSKSGSIWAGTQNGLNRLDPETGRFTAYDVRNGMAGNSVSCILEDDAGNIWLSSNKGLSKFNPANESFANYSVADGLPGNDLSGWSSCFKSSRGEMFFSGFSGGVAFFPGQLKDTWTIPPILLTDLELSGVTVPVGPNQPLHQSIMYSDHLALSHVQNSFTLKFTAIDYTSPQTTRYRYKLQGLDTRWSDVDSNNRRASYTTLPPGEYDFRVQAASGRGPWNEPGASLRVQILPPWWATWWFRTVYITLVILALSAAYAIRVRQLSRQLTIRMEERITERTRIARDLHDTLLQGLLSASLQLSIARGQLPADVKATPLLDRVVELLRQMIDESRNTVRGLRIRHHADQELEHAISQIPRDLGVKEGLEIDLLVVGERRELRPAIRDEVYWITREAVANAFRHANASTIEAELEFSRHQFRVVVRDNGRGINSQALDSAPDNHWGLLGMAERAKRVGGTLDLSSAKGAGTEVELTIPASVAFEAWPKDKI